MSTETLALPLEIKPDCCSDVIVDGNGEAVVCCMDFEDETHPAVFVHCINRYALMFDVCKKTLNALNGMTSEDFSKGGDKACRKMLEAAIATD